MSKVKNWMMDMEDEIVFAIDSGAKTTDEVVGFVKTNMSIVDERFVAEKTEEIMGEI